MEGTAEEEGEEAIAAPWEGSRKEGQEVTGEKVALDEDEDEVGWQANASASS